MRAEEVKAAEGVVSAAPSAEGVPDTTHTRVDARLYWFIAAVVIFCGLTLLTFVQAPWPDAYNPVPAWQWFWRPIEWNAHKRLARIEGDLYDVFALPDGRHAWAVGDGGLIVHTNNSGRTWVQQPVATGTTTTPRSETPQPKEEARPADEEPRSAPLPAAGASLLLNPASVLLSVASPRPEKGSPRQDGPGRGQVVEEDLSKKGIPTRGADLCAGVECPAGWECVGGECKRVCETDADCDDNDACSTDECASGFCEHTPAVECPAGERCNAATGECEPAFFTPLRAVHMVDAHRGWAVGANGAILRCESGKWTVHQSGEWTAQVHQYGEGPHLNDLWLNADGSEGWAVGDASTILHYAGGEWEEEYTPDLGLPSYLLGLWLKPDGSEGWAVGLERDILRYKNGSWTTPEQSVDVDADVILFSLSLSQDGSRGWAVGTTYDSSVLGAFGDENYESMSEPFGIAQYKDDVWTTFNMDRVPYASRLSGVWLAADGGEGWAVGIHSGPPSENAPHGMVADRVRVTGIILRYESERWEVLDSLLDSFPVDLWMTADGTRGWIVGYEGTILATTDSGASWYRQTQRMDSDEQERVASTAGGPYRRWPAPWYFVSLLLVVECLRRTLRAPEPVTAPQRTVGSTLVSDRPLEAGDPDPLHLGSLAHGISRFLRNRSTSPPLTIAVSGAWGTGKSSLMNLLKADLESRGFRPVWFNAWHHQKEEHLLAALLENIKVQAVPSWWGLSGIGFRGRLLWYRVCRYPVTSLALLFTFGLALGYAGHKCPVHDVDPIQFIRDVKLWDQLTRLAENTASLPGVVLALLGTLFPPLVTLWKGLRAFGINPGELMATGTRSARARDLGAQAGFRYRFEAQFADVTRALGPRRMVIMIDDLDRCRPKNVLEVLEAVNFLVSSGECFVTLGMDREQVTRCVGIAFKEVAEATIDPKELSVPGGGQRQRALERQIAFADHYMEKLVNIEVRIPRHSPSDAPKIVQQSGGGDSTNGQARRDRRRRLMIRTAAALFSLAVFAGGVTCGITMLQPIPGDPPSQEETSTTRPAVKAGGPPADATTNGATSRPAYDPMYGPTGHPSGRGGLVPGKTDRDSRWLMLLLLLIVPPGLWALAVRPEVVVEDSPDFEAALRLWLPVVATRNNTPRAIKRFLNRVRYYAMLQRPPSPPRRWWQRVLTTLGKEPAEKETYVETQTIPEDLLVAMAAMHRLDDRCVDDSQVWETVRGEVEEFVSPHTLPHAGHVHSAQKKTEDLSRISNQGWLAKFRKLLEGARIE